MNLPVLTKANRLFVLVLLNVLINSATAQADFVIYPYLRSSDLAHTLVRQNQLDANNACVKHGLRLPTEWEVAVLSQWITVKPEDGTDAEIHLPVGSDGQVRKPSLTLDQNILSPQGLSLLKSGNLPHFFTEAENSIPPPYAQPVFISDPYYPDFYYQPDGYLSPTLVNSAQEFYWTSTRYLIQDNGAPIFVFSSKNGLDTQDLFETNAIRCVSISP